MQTLASTGGETVEPGRSRLLRTLKGLAVATGLTSFTVLVFVAMLALTMPASVLATLFAMPPQVETLSGSVWRGRAALSGGHVLDWRVTVREIWLGRLAAEVGLEGPDTRLSGVLAISPWKVSARDWTGRAGPGLLALAPGVPALSCTSPAAVAIERLSLGRRSATASGEVEIAEGQCRDGADREHPVPAMVLRLSTLGRDAQATLVRADATAAPLASLGITGDRRFLVRVEPEGATMIPGMPSSAATILEYPF